MHGVDLKGWEEDGYSCALSSAQSSPAWLRLIRLVTLFLLVERRAAAATGQDTHPLRSASP